MKTKPGGGANRIAFAALFIVVAFTGLFSLSIIDNLPFLKIKKLEILIKDKHLAFLVREAIKNEAENNILFLKLKKDNIAEYLRLKSQYRIENFFIKDIAWLKGIVKLQVIINKPLAIFNKTYCLSQNGRIFKEKKCGTFLVEDKTQSWKLGNVYELTPIIEKIYAKIPLKEIRISKDLIEVHGKGIVYKAYLNEPIQATDIAVKISNKVKQTVNDKKIIAQFNLLGKKIYCVKIIKE